MNNSDKSLEITCDNTHTDFQDASVCLGVVKNGYFTPCGSQDRVPVEIYNCNEQVNK